MAMALKRRKLTINESEKYSGSRKESNSVTKLNCGM
jgi:hypothetical protein